MTKRHDSEGLRVSISCSRGNKAFSNPADRMWCYMPPRESSCLYKNIFQKKIPNGSSEFITSLKIIKRNKNPDSFCNQGFGLFLSRVKCVFWILAETMWNGGLCVLRPVEWTNQSRLGYLWGGDLPRFTVYKKNVNVSLEIECYTI